LAYTHIMDADIFQHTYKYHTYCNQHIGYLERQAARTVALSRCIVRRSFGIKDAVKV